jgi:hypothetical protein
MRMANAFSMQHITLMLTNMALAHGQCIFDATIQDMPSNMGGLMARALVMQKLQLVPSLILCMVPPPPQADCMAGPNLLMPCQFPSAQLAVPT